MADSLQHVAPGDPLSISADTWNLLLDAARVLRRDGPRALGRGQSTEELWRPAVVVLVANGSGASRQPGEVLTPTAAAVEPTDDEHGARRRPALSGETPATEDDAVLVLLDGATTGAVARAVAAGVTVANVQVTDLAHRYARAVPGDSTKLVSADSGPAYLLVPPDATGTALRYVLLGAPPDGAGGSSGVGLADLFGPESARTGQLALFSDPSGRFVAPATTLTYQDFTNPVGGLGTNTQQRAMLCMTMAGDTSDPYPRNAPNAASRGAQWQVVTFALRDAINPTSGRVPGTANPSSLHTSANQFILSRAVGSQTETVISNSVYRQTAHRADGGVCFILDEYTFADVGTAFYESMWYDSTAGDACRWVTYRIWQKHYADDGTPGISGSCTVKVGGVDKTLTFQDGIITGLA